MLVHSLTQSEGVHHHYYTYVYSIHQYASITNVYVREIVIQVRCHSALHNKIHFRYATATVIRTRRRQYDIILF